MSPLKINIRFYKRHGHAKYWFNQFIQKRLRQVDAGDWLFNKSSLYAENRTKDYRIYFVGGQGADRFIGFSKFNSIVGAKYIEDLHVYHWIKNKTDPKRFKAEGAQDYEYRQKHG